MNGLNKAYLIGNIGHEPELRTSASGKPILKVNIATPFARKVDDAWIDAPDWHRLTLFDRNAEYVGRHAHKGDGLAVECAIRPNKWTDKENVVHHEVNLIVERVLWLSSRKTTAPVAVPSTSAALKSPVDVDVEPMEAQEPPF